MRGWILYKRSKAELTEADHGVNRFLHAATDLQLELEVYKPSQFDVISTEKKNPDVLLDGQRVLLPDFILPRLGAEATSFDLALLRHFEFQGVYSANSASAIETVKNKMLVSQLMMGASLPHPKTMLLKFPVSLDLIEQEIGFPLVIKNVSGVRGVGVYLCESATSFRDLVGLFSAQCNHQMIVQQFIANSYGRDLRVFVLANQVIGCMQRTAIEGFKANFSLGGNVENFPLTSEVELLALACTKAVGLEIAGIDLLFASEGFFICEANSSPGFKGMELAGGMDIATTILKKIILNVNGEKA
jgi:gamma-F420-2:alpha-L-glutamate ligase